MGTKKVPNFVINVLTNAKVFGRSLAEILHAEGKEIPQFVQDAIKYIEDSLLDVEGVLFIANAGQCF